jgi:hypothetical protein
LNTADSNSVEVGVRFSSSVNGSIQGIRFYKGANNTGTHVGSLWTNSGQLLAQATFTNETATGWQQVQFATPVQITAGTVYVASYHAPAGNYSSDHDYFTTAYSSPPLQALQDGVSGSNGVYLYGAGFPTNTYLSTNYWVDVIFSPSS